MNVIRNGHDALNKPLFIFGEEQKGLSDYILSNSDRIVTISGRGTVRSLNVGTASGIVLSTYASLFPQTNV
jgi:23S rRNA (guanosine2251-2'-O)-methyltransferase